MDFYRNIELLNTVSTPFFAVDRVLLKKNCEILSSIRKNTNAKILAALKAFSMFSTFPLLREYLDGICASSPYEARLGHEEFQKEVHSFAAAFSTKDYQEIKNYSGHIVFNSLNQYKKFYRTSHSNTIQFGLRINPEHRETEVELYDPAAPFSRLGITKSQFPNELPEGISGLHFHTLCQQDSYALERTVRSIEKNFSNYLHKVSWLNIGGGHHITREDYNIEHLCSLISYLEKEYNLNIYIEPGEAIALNAGFLAVDVLDIIENEMKIAILNVSAAAHTPDVLEMPYRPEIINSGNAGEKKYIYRLAGLSCLAGDIYGDYSFDNPLKIGERLYFTDMAIYSMVKTNTFNGLALPSIVYYDSDEKKILHSKHFNYFDFKGRLS
jgi:carboxynorspermidine decarboxylase